MNRSNLRCYCMEELSVGRQGGDWSATIIREAKSQPFSLKGGGPTPLKAFLGLNGNP